jgi:hypothetical protein
MLFGSAAASDAGPSTTVSGPSGAPGEAEPASMRHVDKVLGPTLTM